MNKTQKGLSATLTILIVLVVGVGIYMYSSYKKLSTDPEVTNLNSTSTPVVSTEGKSDTLTDAQFISVTSKDAEDSEVRARGDINGDGYEDAIVQEMYCGASCSFNLQVVFNNAGKPKLFESDTFMNFTPAYNGSGAAKSTLTSVTINNGIISFKGKGLECGVQCDEQTYNVEKTVTFKYDGKTIVQIPNITSISKTSGPIGTTIELKGTGLSGFEGDLDAIIENEKGEIGVLLGIGTVPRVDQTIRVKIDSKLCTVNNSYSGNPCEKYLTITPGTYKIYTNPWGTISNKVTFTVTN